jgi:hypothetical protein
MGWVLHLAHTLTIDLTISVQAKSKRNAGGAQPHNRRSTDELRSRPRCKVAGFAAQEYPSAREQGEEFPARASMNIATVCSGLRPERAAISFAALSLAWQQRSVIAALHLG